MKAVGGIAGFERITQRTAPGNKNIFLGLREHGITMDQQIRRKWHLAFRQLPLDLDELTELTERTIRSVFIEIQVPFSVVNVIAEEPS